MKKLKRLNHKKSDITQNVLHLAEGYFADHFDTLEPFYFAVTRSEALLELRHFIGDPAFTTGEDARPFNALYWDFVAPHQDNLRGNRRMPYVFSTWEKFSAKKQIALRQQTVVILQKMKDNQL